MRKIFYNRLESAGGVHKEILNPDAPYSISFMTNEHGNTSRLYSMEITMNDPNVHGNDDIDIVFFITHIINGKVVRHNMSEKAVLLSSDEVLQGFDTAINRFIFGEDFDED